MHYNQATTDFVTALVALDPRDYVKSGLDSYAPYAYFELPASLQSLASAVEQIDDNLVSEILDTYLDELRNCCTRGVAQDRIVKAYT